VAACQHTTFDAEVTVNRLQEGEGGPAENYMADVRIRCAECGVSFRFIGLPAGLDLRSPTVSVDATEGHFPILPRGAVLSELEGTPIGFSVRKVGP
jgi:hypothetical protein